MSGKRKVVIIRETVWESWASDIGSVVALTAMVGIGILLDSTVLQWIGGIVGILALASRQLNQQRIMTIAEARAYLDSLDTSHEEEGGL